MSIISKKYLAIDSAYDQAVVILFDDQNILFEIVLTEKFAHGRHIAGAIKEILHKFGKPDVMLVGLGPGSFMGLRISLSTALGYSFGADIPLMGFCSHQALACSILNTNLLPELIISMKASGDLFYVSNFKYKNNTWELIKPIEVLNPEQIKNKLTQVLPGPSSYGVWQACRLKLATHGIIDESAYIKPNYIKDPNVSVSRVVARDTIR